MSQSTEMLVKAGVIPKESLKEMKNWKTVEEETVQSHGSRKVSIEENPEVAEEFTATLKEVIDQDMQEIRETDFGPTKPISVSVGVDGGTIGVMASVDNLGRVHLPYRRRFAGASTIHVGDDVRKIIRIEERFHDEKPVAWVCYLE